jgi:uncharacterized membrane protein (DUF485 family)
VSGTTAGEGGRFRRTQAAPSRDWQAIEASPEFQELVRRRRAFVIPATIFYLAWYMGFILLAAYAKGFMSERVYQGLTVGYCLALTQFVMVLVLGIMYLRRADKVFDPLAERAVARWTHLDTDAARADRADRADRVKETVR